MFSDQKHHNRRVRWATMETGAPNQLAIYDPDSGTVIATASYNDAGDIISDLKTYGHIQPSRASREHVQTERELLEEIEVLLKRILGRLESEEAITRSIAVQFTSPTGEPTMSSQTLQVGQSTTATIVPVGADGKTPVTGATLSNQSISITDASLTTVVNADGTVTIAGVAPSTGAVTGTASATVTDPDGAVDTYSTSFEITVVAAPPAPQTEGIIVTFSTPVAATPAAA